MSSALFESQSTTIMWAPLGVFGAILIILVILLTLPFLVARLRRNPAIDRVFETLGRLIGAPQTPHPRAAHLRPISRSALDSLTVMPYRCSADPENLEADCCPICFCEYSEGQPIIRLSCSHYFHKACITKWVKRDATCPLCKACLDPEKHSKHLSSSSSSSNSAHGAASSAVSVTVPAAATGGVLRAPPPAQRDLVPASPGPPPPDAAATSSIAAEAGHTDSAAACAGRIMMVAV